MLKLNVFLKINPKCFDSHDASAAKLKELLPLIEESLLKQAIDRSWQERAVLENNLGGLEVKLMEAELQEILLN